MSEELLHEKRDSIEISKNAKGEVAWKIKRYYDSGTQKQSDVVDDIEEIHEALKERFL
jgi:hypothetical protein